MSLLIEKMKELLEESEGIESVELQGESLIINDDVTLSVTMRKRLDEPILTSSGEIGRQMQTIIATCVVEGDSEDIARRVVNATAGKAGYAINRGELEPWRKDFLRLEPIGKAYYSFELSHKTRIA